MRASCDGERLGRYEAAPPLGLGPFELDGGLRTAERRVASDVAEVVLGYRVLEDTGEIPDDLWPCDEVMGGRDDSEPGFLDAVLLLD